MGETYQPNSFKSKEEAKLAEVEKKKVISTPAKIRKKSDLEKIADKVFAKDARDVGSYIIGDLLIPKLTDLIIDIVTGSVNMIFKGQPAPRKSRDGYTNYNASYRNDRSYSRNDRDDDYRNRSTRLSYKDIVLDTREDALEVLREMQYIIDEYGEVSVARLFDICQITGEHTDNKYGWTDLSYAEPIRVEDGYGLRLPRPRPLGD